MTYISETGYWGGEVKHQHFYDFKLAQQLLRCLREAKCSNVLDLGCGLGDYCRFFIENNLNCECYDGNKDTEYLTNGLCKTYDLATFMDLDKTFDCVMSLEVGEHIPADYEDVFLDNITRHSSKIIILSWAIPGQNGHGHVNCRSNDYITNKMFSKDFIFDENISQTLKRNCDLSWFKNTIMFFKKSSYIIG